MTTSLPPAPPTGGSGKNIAVVAVLTLGIIGLLSWKACQKQEVVATTVPSSVPSTPVTAPDPHIDDVPPPPPEEPDAGPTKTTRTGTNSLAGCDMKTCGGTLTGDLETALAFRAKQAHRCYDQALAQDSSLKGKVQISVRIAPSGGVCSAGVTSNDMGTPSVAQCVASVFRGSGHFPAPKGGCVDANVPISFVPGGR